MQREARKGTAPSPLTGVGSRLDQVLATNGVPLNPSTRTFMESRLDQNLGRVQIHTGPAAVEAASSLNARAFTIGNNVVFGANQYAPGTPAGQP